ncbi:MAG: hypothetical protein ACTHQE_17895 [Thermomicrobiales bacterium]
MAITSISDAIRQHLEAQLPIMALLPGGIWTRPIRRNDNPDGSPPVPGSTPGAFDGAGRIKACASIEPGIGNFNPAQNRAYWAFPEVHLRCLPHESEKAKLEDVRRLIIAAIEGQMIRGPSGEALHLRVSGHIGPDDDPIIQPAVVTTVTVQIDSIWKG